MKFTKLFVVTAMSAVAAASTAHAQLNCGGGGTEPALGPATTGCVVTSTVSNTVPTVARLEITTATTDLTTPLAADFGTAAGVNTTGPKITVRANANHTLTASPAAWTGTGNNAKPVTDIKMQVNGGGFIALGTVGTAASPKTPGTDYQIDYNTIYNWVTDTPGTYSLVISYTLTAP